ncbi:Uma2 family endonuclease [Chamaesiphon sp. VAR_69_metabat_338]|uniref:Uma2 family endonuclease n=1 Tax=Chamaesiphon sp. VAR_69_metabat_338 TaxID=2964704 RepID=UPI00286E67FF|nr:Uma2 family endonuclease [Chamaesiphon sp. VAR_69_metabat_338]
MYAVVSADRISIPPGSVLRIPGSWQDFCQLRDNRGNGSIPRLRYRHGEILLMSPLPRHGREANIIADIVKALLNDENRNYEAFTPITMELPEVGGIEPDYCFYIDNWQAVVGKDRIDWKVDLPPDLAIEIDVTSFTSELDFLPFNVPEVWIFKNYQLTIYQLAADKYEVSETSRYFPDVLLQQTIDACFVVAKEKGTGAAINELRRFLSN